MKKIITILCILTLLMGVSSALAKGYNADFVWNKEAEKWSLAINDIVIHGDSSAVIVDQIASLLDTKATEYDTNWDIYLAPNKEETYLCGLENVTPLTRIIPMKDESSSAMSVTLYLEPKKAEQKAADIAAIAAYLVSAYGNPDRVESYNYDSGDIVSLDLDVTDAEKCAEIVPVTDTDMYWIAFSDDLMIYITTNDIGVSLTMPFDD